MAHRNHAILPNSKPPQPMSPFAAGSLVHLRGCPGPPGQVRGMVRGRVCVFWPDLSYIGKHKAASLVLAGSKEKKP